MELIGVMTTGIYCVVHGCSGRPKPENTRRFSSTEEARAAGLRPCKVCKPDVAAGDSILVELGYSAPLPLRELLAFFGRRAVPGVEELDGSIYRRSLRLTHGLAVAEIHRGAKAQIWLDDPRDRDEAVARCRALLDLDANPAAIAGALSDDVLIGDLVRQSPGRRVPGAAHPHEIAFRAVLGQQVSLAGAATVAGRLTAALGEPLSRPMGRVTHAFPSAQALAAADASRWPMPAARSRALQTLARALASNTVDLADRDALLALPGIGPWTAAYIRMRAIHDPDAFLAGDLGVRHALERLGQDARPAAAERLSETWRPYRAYALQHLWASA